MYVCPTWQLHCQFSRVVLHVGGKDLQDLSHEKGWVKQAENLSASPFMRDLSIDTTFCQNPSRWTVPLKRTFSLLVQYLALLT